MDAQFLPSHYGLIGNYIGVGSIIQNGETVLEDVARVRQRDLVLTFQAGMDPVFRFLRTCPSAPEYEDWFAETDGPWGDEDFVGLLSSMGYLVTISPSTFLNKEFASMLTVKFQETPEHDLPPSSIENVADLATWYSLSSQRAFTDMRNSLLVNENMSLQEVDEFFGREIPALLRSQFAFLDWAEKREKQGVSDITSITL